MTTNAWFRRYRRGPEDSGATDAHGCGAGIHRLHAGWIINSLGASSMRLISFEALRPDAGRSRSLKVLEMRDGSEGYYSTATRPDQAEKRAALEGYFYSGNLSEAQL